MPSGAARARIAGVPTLPPGTVLTGLVPADRPLRVTVALRPRDPAALAAYAQTVSNPGSRAYRRFLTVAGFRRRFAPVPATIARVLAALRRAGLRPDATRRDGLSIPIRATVGSLEHAFSVTLAEVRLPGGAGAVVASAAPAFDRAVAGDVAAVVGLSSLGRPRPLLGRPGSAGAGGIPSVRVGAGGIPPARAGAGGVPAARTVVTHVATGGPQPCPEATAAAPGQQAHTNDQIASAYGFAGLYRRGDEGQGATVALYELEPDDPNDIAAYQACYGTHARIDYVPVDGGAGTGPGSGEAALDIEQVVGLAPRAHVIVYQGPNSGSSAPGAGPYDTASEIVSQDAASVVSISWGQCEPLEGQANASAENALFEEAAIQGQSVVSAAGDSGAEDCEQPPPAVPDTELAVDDPASQPFVTGVGGTSLPALGPPPGETAWNNGGNLTGLLGVEPGAGGGGLSALWAMPAYQALSPAGLHVRQPPLSSGSPCGAAGGVLCREVPDVAADADPRTGYLIYFNGSGQATGLPQGWQGTGGTSAAAPLWGALLALANADGACHRTSVGFINPALYRLGGSSGRVFHDVTTGNNDYTGTAGGRYPAASGYDMATGLGSPDAAALAPVLCRTGLRLGRPGRQYAFRGHYTSLHLPVSDAAGAGLTLRARGLPPGMALDRRTGRISGRPRRIGSYRVAVEALDSGGGVRAMSFPWTIDGLPRVSGARLIAAGVLPPALRLLLTAGRREPRITTIELILPAGLTFTGRGRAVSVTAGGRRLPARVSGTGARVHVRLLDSGAPRVRVSLGGGALRGKPSSASVLRVAVTDAAHGTARLTAGLRAGR